MHFSLLIGHFTVSVLFMIHIRASEAFPLVIKLGNSAEVQLLIKNDPTSGNWADNRWAALGLNMTKVAVKARGIPVHMASASQSCALPSCRALLSSPLLSPRQTCFKLLLFILSRVKMPLKAHGPLHQLFVRHSVGLFAFARYSAPAFWSHFAKAATPLSMLTTPKFRRLICRQSLSIKEWRYSFGSIHGATMS